MNWACDREHNYIWPAPCDPREGSKGHFKDFIPNFVCLLTNKRFKTYRAWFSFCRLGMPQEWDLGVLGSKF